MIYEISNPSDQMTVEAGDGDVAAAAVLVLGEGAYGLTDRDGADVLPILLFGGGDEYIAARFGDLSAYLLRNAPAVAACLRSLLYGSIADREAFDSMVEIAESSATDADRAPAMREAWNERQRSSLNDIGGRARRLADALLRAAEEGT